MEHNVLLLLGRVDERLRAGHELILDVLNKGNNEGGDDAEDEAGKLLLELLDNLGKNGDLLNGGSDALHDLVVKLDGRHDLMEAILYVTGELLGFAGRDFRVLHLSVVGVGLYLINLITLVLVSEEAIGDLVEEVSEHTGVGLSRLLKCTLELVDLVLSELVGDLASNTVKEVDTSECTTIICQTRCLRK